MMRTVTLLLFLFYKSASFAQFTHADTLRGSNGAGRSWWDVLHYDISIKPDFSTRSISGKINILFSTNDSGDKTMQVDLRQPMQIDKALFENTPVQFKQEGNVWWLYLKDIQPKMYIDRAEGGKGVTKKEQAITIYFHGRPEEAVKPPWENGLIWTKDDRGNPWFTLTCQGLGASIWYPCKDYQGDEPDYGATVTITTPDSLIAISNGKLTATKKNGNTIDYTWAVKNPINNYNIIPYIGKYVNFNENYKGIKGNLKLNYWVLDYNLDKARKQFTDVPKTIKAFEYWFGPYPFYDDDFKIVEAPHLGMEHQSAIAYGNGFNNGYNDVGDLSESGWGLKWDYIIVHESAHEWFGNSITSRDIADMWIHESFACYAETLFTEYYYGRKAATEYISGIRKRIYNDSAIIGPYGVNTEGSRDMYHKGANMIHTIRQVINDDEKFRDILRGLNTEFYHAIVTSKQVEDYFINKSGKDLSKIFDQYLRTVQVPVLEYRIAKGMLNYRWKNCVRGFNMPVKIMLAKNEFTFIYPTETFKSIRFNGKRLTVDNNFYIKTSGLQ
jgi:aminopeptidase N